MCLLGSQRLLRLGQLGGHIHWCPVHGEFDACMYLALKGTQLLAASLVCSLEALELAG